MRLGVLVLTMLLASASSAQAQGQTETLPPEQRPLKAFAFDLRGFYNGLGQDPVTASDLGVSQDALPRRGLGAVAGLHLYPLRRASFALGIGIEGLLSQGRSQAKDTTTGEPIGPVVTQRLRSFAPQISLNFGHREGWSYLSAGMGPLSFSTYQGKVAPSEPPPVQSTINMGGGARWFNSAHLAFCFDVRFYLTRPQDPTISYPGRQRARLLVLSAGIALK